MAKRKRLTPAQPGYLDSPAPARGPLAPPIAQVASAASTSAALEELSETLRAARVEGRLIQSLPLEAVDETYLVRDRLPHMDNEEMDSLMRSLQTRGQQAPIEVVALPEPGKNGATHGLVSGWRRLVALRRLHGAHPEEARFATVQARIIQPADAREAYVAMVEENEIRAALSLYEKGRITLRAVHEGVYPSPREALRGLFGSVSRSRRSKIGTFLTLVEPLDRVLRFPEAIPEKLGLSLAKALQEDQTFSTALISRLKDMEPESADAELDILRGALLRRERALKSEVAPPAANPTPPPAARGAGSRPRITGRDPESVAQRLEEGRIEIRFDANTGQIILTGGGVTEDLHRELKAWLETRES
jgi:ParB family transcriptional regulator, chromosome partitioning protein